MSYAFWKSSYGLACLIVLLIAPFDWASDLPKRQPEFSAQFRFKGRSCLLDFNSGDDDAIKDRVFVGLMSSAHSRLEHLSRELKLRADQQEKLSMAILATNWRLLNEVRAMEKRLAEAGRDKFPQMQFQVLSLRAKIEMAPFYEDMLARKVLNGILTEEQKQTLQVPEVRQWLGNSSMSRFEFR